MRNPFSNDEGKEAREHARNVERWSRMNPDMGRVIRTQPVEIQRLMGEEIQKEWELKARDSGQVFKEEIPDERTGRMIERFHGDIKAAYEPFMIPGTPIKLTKTIWHKGTPYLETQVPDHVALERSAMRLGIALPVGED